MRSFAAGSPRSTRFASATSSAAVSSGQRPASFMKSVRLSIAPDVGTAARPPRSPSGGRRPAAGLVHEEREAVDRTRCGYGGTRHRLRMGGRDHLDATLLELGPEGGQLLLVQLVLVGGRLEDLLLELSELLRFVDEGAWFQFSKLGQSFHSSTSAKNGRLGGATLCTTFRAPRVFLQQDLTRLLVRKDLTLYPLQCVVNRLGVAAQLLC